jgi:hypothetical protein
MKRGLQGKLVVLTREECSWVLRPIDEAAIREGLVQLAAALSQRNVRTQ